MSQRTQDHADSPAERKLTAFYNELAESEDDRVTALDYNLRDLEIHSALKYISDGDALLDVGCGMGVAIRAYGGRRKLSRAVGIDRAEKMIEVARRKAAEASFAGATPEFQDASVYDLPFEARTFDVVTCHRVLMALLTWENQENALAQLARVLRPGGTMILFEGMLEGLERLNDWRRRFGLEEVAAGGRGGYERLLFSEAALLEHLSPAFELVSVERFGMYYFLSRIVQPLFVEPEAPHYDHRLNDVARRIAEEIPDLDEMGHLVGLVLRKRADGADPAT